MSKNIDLVTAFMQIDGGFMVTAVCNNYGLDGSVKLHTDHNVGMDIVIDAMNVTEIEALTSIEELYEYYKSMEYFNQRLGRGGDISGS